MQENNEITPEEIKAFMNEPEPEEATKPPPAPMGMDDWEGTPENDKAKTDHKLTTDRIAEIAYMTVGMTNHFMDVSSGFRDWDVLTDTERLHYTGLVNFFMNSLANPNGHESAQALHDLMLDAKLVDGWRYGQVYDEIEKTDPSLMSYRGLPPQFKVRNFLFRCVVVGLREVWKGH